MDEYQPPAAPSKPTRRRILITAGGAAVVLALGALPVLRSRRRHDGTLNELFTAQSPPGCREAQTGLLSLSAADLGTRILDLYPWHDMRDLRWLAAPGVICDPPTARLAWYPELAVCAELRNQAAGVTHGDVLDLVLDALESTSRASIPSNIQGPDGLEISLEVPAGRSAPHLARRLLDAPPVRLDAVSTAPLERNISGSAAAAFGRFLGRPGPAAPSRPPWSLYLKAQGVDETMAPTGLDSLAASLRHRFGGTVNRPQRLWLGDFRILGDRLEALPTDRYLDLENHRGLFAMADQLRPAAREAALLLADSHPGYPATDLEALLLANLLVEMFWLGPEDPWQDLGAARAYDAPIADPLGAAVDAARRSGDVAVGPLRKADGQVLDVRLPGAWRLATLVESPLRYQGLGPAQLIVGLVRESAAFKRGGRRLWDRYFPGRTLQTRQLVQVCLEPTEAVTATGMVYDFLLDRMHASILADPEAGWPADLYPFPRDSRHARRLLALSLLRTFKAFPEMLWRYPEPRTFPYWHHTLNQDTVCDALAVVAAVWNLDLDLGLEARVVPARLWNRALVDHFDANSPSGLQVTSVPAGARGGSPLVAGIQPSD